MGRPFVARAELWRLERHGPGRALAARVVVGLLAIWLFTSARPCQAQTPAALHLDTIFYGDNSEFFGPFRSGETVLGSVQRIVFEITPGPRATLQLGLYAIERAGSHSPVDHALPIVSLRMGSAEQAIVFGTLRPGDRRLLGPDRTTPHGLLPPLAVETQWFTRAYEAGLQWLSNTRRYSQDLWFDYQVGNTGAFREKFDAGVVGRVRVAGPWSVGYQAHVVHHGGQQHNNGPVSDSAALGSGVIVAGRVGGLDTLSLELYGLAAKDGPNRADPSLEVAGKAVFLRAAAEAHRLRVHLIMWRGIDFNHEDGDPNYLSTFPDGVRFRKVRDYSEAGIAKLFRPAPGLELEASARLHRIETTWAYSYRVLATLHLTLWRGTVGARG